MGATHWVREYRGVTSGSTTIYIYKIYNIKSLKISSTSINKNTKNLQEIH
jgi:hypothetical protein